MNVSSAALKMMQTFAKQYVSEGSPSRRTELRWTPEPGEEPVFDELKSVKLIEMTGDEALYVLTPTGFDFVRKNRAS